MNKLVKKLRILGLVFLMALVLAVPAFAAEEESGEPASQTEVQEEEGGVISGKALATALAIGLAAAGGGVGMGVATGKAVESIGRQPEAESKIRTMLMLGLVFIETAIIYALLVVILIIFVL